MKKLLFILLTLVMAVAVTFGLIACQQNPEDGGGDICVHVYADEYTCHDRTCTKCGEVLKATTAHAFVDNKQCACGEYNPEY